MTIDEVIEMLNSEDCKLATSICLMRYRERDCWKCILKEYSKTVYNKAIDDFMKELQKKIEKDLANPDLALECKKCGIWKNYDIEEIAEQLKAGGKNV